VEKIQFDRWQDFAIRMAQSVFETATKVRQEKIIKNVKDYFSEREFQDDWDGINDWDGNGDDYFLGDDVNDYFDIYRHWNSKTGEYEGKFLNQITCCIRAGFDMAVKQSGGVVGFTVGDVRKMFDGKVPDWIKKRDWENPFDSFADDSLIWL